MQSANAFEQCQKTKASKEYKAFEPIRKRIQLNAIKLQMEFKSKMIELQNKNYDKEKLQSETISLSKDYLAKLKENMKLTKQEEATNNKLLKASINSCYNQAYDMLVEMKHMLEQLCDHQKQKIVCERVDLLKKVTDGKLTVKKMKMLRNLV